MIPSLQGIIDTQCGFKAFKADLIPHIVENMIESKFAFDIELLLRSLLIRENSVQKIPIAWIDSEAASTTTDLQPYLAMLKAISAMGKKYFPEKISIRLTFKNAANYCFTPRGNLPGWHGG